MLKNKCFEFLSCPIDGSDMVSLGKSVCCVNKHSFDVSKEGYINMLTSDKRFKQKIGDVKDMLLARSNFLQSGYYNFLSEEINKIAIRYLQNNNNKDGCILEVGCGTAFYLKRLKDNIDNDLKKEFCYFGTDISKEAIKISAKKYKDINFIVADTYFKIPIKNKTVKIILNIFSPRNPEEFSRLLDDKGIIITVIPNENHLNELIEKFGLVKVEQEKKKHLMDALDGQFDKIEDYNFTKKISLKSNSIIDLIKMGPSYKCLNDKKIINIKNMNKNLLEVTASFNILVFVSKSR
ncbi:MAG: hypothetical protein GX627_02965 [Parcubacteria group bacterium]|nr:hypothetical protein [Parcubacteria group bacterium]